jgi:hypothetical protein
MNLISIFFCVFLDSLICIGYGSLLFHLFRIKNYKNIITLAELIITGLFLTGIISLFLNFIIPINLVASNCIALLGVLLFLIFFYKNFKKDLILFLISLIPLTLLLLIFSEHQQDFPWYSLPFIANLNQEKISFGLANVQYRFGFISLLQYSSATFNNYFSTNNIIVPYSLISSSFIIFSTKFFLEKKSYFKNKISFLYLTLVLIFCLIKFTRLSSYGNDVPLHILIFYCIYRSISILENYKNKVDITDEIKKLIIFSTFAILQKIQGSLIILFPVYIIIIINNKIRKKLIVTTLFAFLCLSAWSLKTFINTGCFVYPAKFTCINTISWVGKNQYQHSYAPKVKIENEAWAKAWIDQKKEILNYEDYSKNFNWFKTWTKKHLIVILKNILPFILITTIPFTYLLFNKNYLNLAKIKKNYIENFKILILLITTNVIVWFVTFPLFRYGISFIISGIIFLIILLLIKFNKDLLYKVLKIIIVLLFLFFISKNLFRIVYSHKEYAYSPWPKIFSEKNNYIKNYKKILKDNGQYILQPEDEHACYYSPHICSHSGHVQDKKLIIKFNKWHYKSYEYK